jgi:hypothetical protein
MEIEMAGKSVLSQRLRAAAAILQVFLTILLLDNSALAITVACAKNTTATLSQNGIVAPGAAGPCGAVGPVWPQIAPLEMQPSGSNPDGYLYLAYNPNVNHLYIGVDSSGDPDVSNNDDIVIVFHSTGNPDFATGDFYIRVPVISSNADINSGVDCSQISGTIDYYTFVTGTGWTHEDDPSVAAAIQAHSSYRYDGGNKLWNLEIDMPISVTINGTKYFDLPDTVNADPTKRIFGLGAYYFISTGNPPVGLNPKPLKWPGTMTDRQDYSDQFMGSLSTPLHGNQLGNVNLSDVCLDVNFNVSTPWEIDGVAAQVGEHHIVRGAVNTFTTTFLYSGPGTTVGNLPNTGSVAMSLVPYSAAGSGPAWAGPSQGVTAPNFNQTQSLTFSYDFSQMPASWAPYEPVTFVCGYVTLSGFNHDDDPNNNVLHANNNYFTTSDYKSSFWLFGDNVPNQKGVEAGTVYLRLASVNEIGSGTGMAGLTWVPPSRWNRTTVALLIAILISFGLLLTMQRKRPFRKRLAPGAVVALSAISIVIYVGCREEHLPKTRWQVQNAHKLGLEPVKGYPDLYKMPIKPGEAKQVDLFFTGRKLPYTPVHQRLVPANSDGQPNIIRIPVKSSRVVTVIAYGNMKLDGPKGKLPVASPRGIIVADRQDELKEAASTGGGGYLLNSTYYVSNQYAGALIGSFDGFKTSFVVGRSNSIVIPAEVEVLSLAVNAVQGQYSIIDGYYDLVIIDTLGPQVPTHTAIRGDATGHVPIMLPIWKVLTSLEVNSYYVTHTTDPKGEQFQTLNPIGAAQYSIYESHVQ